jgi:hypothetical protein
VKYEYIGIRILTVVSIHVKFFWDVTLCQLVNRYQLFGEIKCFNLAGDTTFLQIVGEILKFEMETLRLTET